MEPDNPSSISISNDDDKLMNDEKETEETDVSGNNSSMNSSNSNGVEEKEEVSITKSEVPVPQDDSDSDEEEDEDYVPGQEGGEEEDENDKEVSDEEYGLKGKKRKFDNGKSKSTTRRQSKRRRRRLDDDEDSDDDDEDFTVNQRYEDEEDEEECDLDPEEIKRKEQAEKERTDKLWESFLGDVAEREKQRKEGRLSNGKSPQEKTVTKFYDFAGQKVRVEEKVRGGEPKPGPSNGAVNGVNGNVENGDDSIPENCPKGPKKFRVSFLSGNPADIGLSGGKGVTAREGLANVLNALNARNKKLGTLEKSKLDWEVYKKDQKLEEELALHNRSRNGYIDKQEFLQRSDLRQFELEKAARAKRRRPL